MISNEDGHFLRVDIRYIDIEYVYQAVLCQNVATHIIVFLKILKVKEKTNI